MPIPARNFILLFFLCASFSHLYSQRLKGNIRDSENKPMGGINVLIKKPGTDGTVLQYAISDAQGNYTISLKPDLDAFIIEFRSFAYKTEVIEISDLSQFPNPYILNVYLENDLTELEEVIVKSEKRPITINNDTTSYNISAFKDGTERVVEDLLRKLPGIKVAENGKITFKGQDVESVLLDGDDLFDANYTLGTRNIDVEMIEGLSAIENHSKNPLLKGIEYSDAVAINLELKKGKTDFSNSTNLGIGVENKADIHTNVLGVSKKHKSFSTASFNNIGKEYSPSNSFSSDGASLEDQQESDLNVSKIIQDGNFSTEISEERSRVGDNIFGSINSINNFTEHFRGKVNIDYTNNRFIQTQTNQTKYFDLTNATDVYQEETITKKPEFYNGKLDFTYKFGENLLESNTKFTNKSSASLMDINLNNSPQKSETQNKYRQFRQVFNLINRFNGNSALSSKLLFNNSSLVQNLFVDPDLRFSDSLHISGSQQDLRIEKNNFKFHTLYLQSGADYNFRIGTGLTYEKTELSSLLNSENINLPISRNNLTYTHLHPWLDVDLFYKTGKWSFNPGFQAKYLFSKLEEETDPALEKNENTLSFLPRISIIYRFNSIANLSFSGRYNEMNPTVNRLYEKMIFTSNRTSQANVANLDPLKNYIFNLSYNYNDLFNLFQFNAGINYTVNKNTYFSLLDIQDVYIVSSNVLFDEGSENLSLHSNIDKYVGFLKSNVRFNLSYTHGTVKNIVNNSDFRDNAFNAINSDLNIKTGFLGMINFENNFRFQTSFFKAENQQTIENTSIQNSFRLFLKPTKQLRFTVNTDYYMPNVAKRKTFLFFDTSLTYIPTKGNVEYSLISKNITANQSIYNSTDITDYSISDFSYRLQDPYLLFNVKFRL